MPLYCPGLVESDLKSHTVKVTLNFLPSEYLDFWDRYTLCCYCLVTKLCQTLCNRMDYNLPGSFVHGISQARTLEWVAISFSRGSFPPRDWPRISCISSTGRRILNHWTTREPIIKQYNTILSFIRSPDYTKTNYLTKWKITFVYESESEVTQSGPTLCKSEGGNVNGSFQLS